MLYFNEITNSLVGSPFPCIRLPVSPYLAFPFLDVLLFLFVDAKLGINSIASKKKSDYFQENPILKPPRIGEFPKRAFHLIII